jgi:hypothetical protein
MGKYLQQLRFEIQHTDYKKILNEKEKFNQSICSLIDTLYNFYLPKKVVVGENIWQITVKITSQKDLDEKVDIFGLGYDSYIFYDLENLNSKSLLEHKTLLLNLFHKGILKCLKDDNQNLKIFEEIYNKVLKDKITFDDFYKEKKISPDKNKYAQLKGFLSENYEKKLFLNIIDKTNDEIKSIFIGNYNFQAFDKIYWNDNNTIFVYHINNIQSYKSKKVAEDYYIVNIENGNVTYNPTTKESMFDYGVQLLTETNEYEKAIEYLKLVRNLGHGKVENIFKNLELNPKERDKTILLQTPKKK